MASNRSDILSPAPSVFSGFCPIPPVPKGRPRFARMGKGVRTFTPKETEEYENAVRRYMEKEYGKDRMPMDGPLRAEYEFILPRPKSAAQKLFWSFTKPDIDNFVKSFQDGLDFKKKKKDVALGVTANDSRISSISATKRYADKGEQPGTRFKISSASHILVVTLGDISVDGLSALDPLIPQVESNDISSWAKRYGKDVDMIYLAISKAPKEQVEAVIKECKEQFSGLKKIVLIRF